MWNAVQWVVKALAGLVVVAAVIYGVARWQGASPEGEAAVRQMEQAVEYPGRNAFAAMWLIRHPVPPAQLEAIAAQDVARFAAAPPPAEDFSGVLEFPSVAVERFPAQDGGAAADAEAGPEWCSMIEQGCLGRVRGARDAFAQRLAGQEPLLARLRALSAYGHHRSGFDPWIYAPMPPVFNVLPVQLTAEALAFVDGRSDTALAGVCGMAGTWRPLVQHSDSLVLSMTAAGTYAAAAGLFAEMLAELPPGQDLPPTCAKAFAMPLPQEGSICEAMKGEFEQVRQSFRKSLLQTSGHERFTASILLDPAATDARVAQRLAMACGEQARANLAADRPLRLPVQEPGWEFACIANAGGCLLSDIAAPAYVDYAYRGQDHVARVRLMATLLWLREQNAEVAAPGAALESLPPALRGPARPVTLSADGSHLQVPLFWTNRGDHWQVPIAAGMP